MTEYIEVAGGRIAYDDRGAGPLIVAVPGMGDLRPSYRLLAPKLTSLGYRVVTLDVRGHGETSVRWDDYSVDAIGRDILDVIRSLDAGPAHVIGNSMSGAAAIVAAARTPAAIRSLTLIDPFVRDMMPVWLMASIIGVVLGGPWRAALWRAYFKKASPTRRPSDYEEEAARRNANLAESGRFAAFRRMALASKRESERRIAEVEAPVLVLMGTKDPDFSDPAKEARHVATLLRAEAAMIEGAGHDPQAEAPDDVISHVLPFLRAVDTPAKLADAT